MLFGRQAERSVPKRCLLRFRNAFKMLFANFGNAYKILLYRLIVLAVFVLIGLACLYNNFNSILQESRALELITSGWDVLKSVFTTLEPEAMAEARAAFAENIAATQAYFAQNMSKVYVLLSVTVVLYLACSFFMGLSNYAVGELTNDHMSSMSHPSFVVSLFKNLGKACQFSLLDVLFSFLFFLAGFGVSLLIFLFAFEAVPLLAVSLSVLVFILVLSLKLSFLSGFMPAMIADGLPVGKALKKSFEIPEKQFGRLYSGYLVYCLVVLYLNLSFTIFTFFVGLILTLPLTFFFLVNMQFVNYYTLEKKKYYVTFDEKVIPKELREDESILKDMDL